MTANEIPSQDGRLPPTLVSELEKLTSQDGRLVILTGAGISAESGIPTFRGPEGFWTVGSSEYHPQQMATYEMFRRHPWEVWQWYLYRIGIYASKGPNAAHRAVAEMEGLLGDRFTLITQNVDGLHLMAGNSLDRTYQIHGNISFMRCSRDCNPALHRLPADLGRMIKNQPLGEAERALLRCPACGQTTRPHVLWFDETYDEQLFRWESSHRAAAQADVLIVVGTSGSTNLPMQVGLTCALRRIPIVDVNVEDTPFAQIAQSSPQGFVLRGAACSILPNLAACLRQSADWSPGQSG